MCKVVVVDRAAVLDENVDATLDQGVEVKVEVAIQGIDTVEEDCQLAKAGKVVGDDLQGAGARLSHLEPMTGEARKWPRSKI